MGKTVLLNGSLAESLVNFRGPLIECLVARGHEVHASAPDLVPDVAGRLRALGATPHGIALARQGTGIVADLRYCRSLVKLIDEVGADQVVNYTIKPNVWGALAARLKGRKSASMITGLGFAFITGDGIARRVAQVAARILYRVATGFNAVVIFQNPDDLADFTSAGCLGDPAKARLVNGSGIDVVHFKAEPMPGEPVFLMISRYLKTKGLREYAQAAAVLKVRHPDWRFRLVGFPDGGPDGVSEAELDCWASGGLELLGEQRDVRQALSDASIYVLPSYREGTPRSVLEAMAMGRPVITTDAPGCRETVRDGHNGLLVAVGDVDDLVRAMEKLGLDRSMRERMGAAGRAVAEEKYEVGQVTEMLVNHLGL